MSAARMPPDVLVVLLDPSGAVLSCAGGEATAQDGLRAEAGPAGRDFRALATEQGLRISDRTERVVREACEGCVPAPFRFTAEWTSRPGSPLCIVTVASRLADDGRCLGATLTLQGVEDIVPLVDEAWTQLRDDSRPVSRALDAIDDGVIIVRTPSLWPVYANAAAMQWLGRSDSGGLTYATWSALAPPALTDLVDVVHAVASGHQESGRRRLRATKSAGEVVWLDVRVRGLESASRPGAAPGHVLIVAHDVTERVQVEERLRISEQSFRATFEHSSVPTLVATVTPGGKRRIVMANKALADVVGRPLESMVGSRAELFRDPVAEQDSLRFAESFLTGEQDNTVWTRADTRADGSAAWFEVMISRIDLAGEATPAALVHLLDVTDKVLATQRKERQSAVIAAHAELVTRILRGEDHDAVRRTMVADLHDVLGADDVALVLQQDGDGEPVVVHGAGPVAAGLASRRAVLDGAPARLFTDDRQNLSVDDPVMLDGGRFPVGAVARFDVDQQRGWVFVARQHPQLGPADLDVLGGFSRQTAMALELGRARADQERLRRLQERHRLARDLHDTVLQDLIAMGVQLGLARKHLDGDAERRVVEVMQGLVETVRTLRAAVFQLQRPLDEQSFPDAVRAVLAGAARALGYVPALTTSGRLDDVPAALQADVLAVLQEALSNVIQHARSNEIDVRFAVAPDRLTLTVNDDGVGLPPDGPRPGQGLVNLAARAEAVGGSSALRARPRGGAALTWSVPLPDAGAHAGA